MTSTFEVVSPGELVAIDDGPQLFLGLGTWAFDGRVEVELSSGLESSVGSDRFPSTSANCDGRERRGGTR